MTSPHPGYGNGPGFVGQNGGDGIKSLTVFENADFDGDLVCIEVKWKSRKSSKSKKSKKSSKSDKSGSSSSSKSSKRKQRVLRRQSRRTDY